MDEVNIESYLKSIGIQTRGKVTSSSYVIDIDSFDELNYYDSLLEKNDDFTVEDELSVLTDDSSVQVFVNDDYRITLIGEFDSDTYKIVVKEL